MFPGASCSFRCKLAWHLAVLSEEQKWATTPTFRGLPLLELSGQTMLGRRHVDGALLAWMVPPRDKLSHEFNLEPVSSKTHLADIMRFDHIHYDPPRHQFVPVALTSVFGENYSQVPGCFVQDMIAAPPRMDEARSLEKRC